MAAQELKEYLENGNITNSVNLPNVSSPRTGDLRICVIHENAKGIIAQITTIPGRQRLEHRKHGQRLQKGLRLLHL